MINNTGNVPTYALTFILNNKQIDGPDELHITNRNLSPSKVELPPIIFSLLESISRDYVYELGESFKNRLTTQLFFSLEKGVVFNFSSDKKIEEIFKRNKQWITFPLQEAQALDIVKFKEQEKISAEIKKQAKKQFKEEKIIYINLLVYLLLQHNFKESLIINLEIKRQLTLNEGGGLTTANLRFPHLLRNLSLNFDSKKTDDQTKICIIGPGFFKEDKGLSFCPQFTEVFSLFPQANFLLLDNNQEALDLMKKQFNSCKFAAYDPLMLRIYQGGGLKSFSAPKKYQKLFQEMQKNLAQQAIGPKNAKEILAGIEKVNNILLKVEPQKIQVREFDINTSPISEEDKGKFDIIIATMSILLALDQQVQDNPSINCFATLGKFLAMLKKTGSLYVDSITFELLKKMYGEKGIAWGLDFLESSLGNRLSFEEVPLSDFLTSHVGVQGTLPSIFIQDSNKDLITSISSSSITRITRMAEKVEYQLESEKKLMNMFKNFQIA